MGASSCQSAPDESLTLEIPPDLNLNSIADPAPFTNRYLGAQKVLVAQTLLSVRFCAPLVLCKRCERQANLPPYITSDCRYDLRERPDMPDILIRPAVRGDLPRLTEIYNYYVVRTP